MDQPVRGHGLQQQNLFHSAFTVGSAEYSSPLHHVSSSQQQQPFDTHPTADQPNLNILQVDRHLLTWLALHSEFHLDNDRRTAGESLKLAHIDAAANLTQCKYGWTIVAAEALERTYYEYDHPLAIYAASCLHEWVDYSIQHEDRGHYATTKETQADDSANEFWRAIKNGMLNAPPPSYEMTVEASLLSMQQQEAVIEAQLAQIFPSRPIRSNPHLNMINTSAAHPLRPDAPIFVPKAQNCPTMNSTDHPHARRQDSGYCSLAESVSTQPEPEQTSLEREGATSTISYVREPSEVQDDFHYQQNETIYAKVIGSSSSSITRTRSEKASVQNYRKLVWVLNSQRTTTGAAVLFDTGCWAGNWISLELLQETHPTMDLSSLSGPKIPYKFLDGNVVYPLGTVRLQWQFEQSSEMSFDKVYTADFNVIDTSLIQMILGARWISENKHVTRTCPVGVLVPNNKKISANEKKRIKTLEENQKAATETANRNRQAAREMARNKQGQQSQSKSSMKSSTISSTKL